jgi:serine protease Do
MNTAIYSPSGGSVGVAFAMPSSTVQAVVDELERDGKVSRGYLGLRIQTLNHELADGLGLSTEKGALVGSAENGSPAARAGLKSGDVITAVNGEAVANAHELTRKVGVLKPGARADVTYLRSGKERTATVELATRPASIGQ